MLNEMDPLVSAVQNLFQALGGLEVIETGDSTFFNPSPESDLPPLD
jgi:hypothetical protein